MMRRAATILATKHKTGVVRIPAACSQTILSRSSPPHERMPTVLQSGRGTTRYLATRRRRSRSMGGTIGGPSGSSNTVSDDDRRGKAPTPIQDLNIFKAAAAAFLDKVEVALEPMQHCNDVFVVTRVPKGHVTTEADGERLTIELKPGDGTYSLQVDEGDKTLQLSSPMSGNFTYVLGDMTHEFVGMDDGHVLEGMIVRDLIRQCNGVPAF